MGGSCEMLSLASTPRFAVAGEEYAWRAQCDGNGGLRRFGASNGRVQMHWGAVGMGTKLWGRVKTEGELLVSHVHQSIPVERHRDLRGTRGVVAGGGVHGASARGAAHRVGRVRRPGSVAAAWERRSRPSARGLRARGSESLEALHAVELAELVVRRACIEKSTQGDALNLKDDARRCVSAWDARWRSLKSVDL